MTGHPTGRLIFATRNRHKLREFEEIVAPLGFAPAALTDVVPDAPDVVEDGLTFLANAALKAIAAYLASDGLPSVADDSGICVAALGGAPGIHSARFAGPECDDSANNARLERDMNGVADRRAHYHCALALVCHRDLLTPGASGAEGLYMQRDWPGLPDGAVLVATEGQVHGEIATTPSGDGGFGYDPYFFVVELGCTFAEVPADVKHAMSHRGKAFRALAGFLERWAVV